MCTRGAADELGRSTTTPPARPARAPRAIRAIASSSSSPALGVGEPALGVEALRCVADGDLDLGDPGAHHCEHLTGLRLAQNAPNMPAPQPFALTARSKGDALTRGWRLR